MLIHEMELKNFGIHRDLKFNSNGDPVIGLLGKNGAGKSTILNALRYAYTGEVDGTIEGAVTSGKKKGHVKIVFEKDGKTGVITREVGKSPKRELVWDGDKFTSVKDVDSRLSEVLGVDKKAFSNACFLRQGSLNDLLFGTESNREQLFIKLVNLSFLDKFCSVLDVKIKSLTSGMEDLTAVKDEVSQQKSQEMEVLCERNEILKQCNDPREASDLVNKLSNVVMTCDELRRQALSSNKILHENSDKLNTIYAAYNVVSLDQLYAKLKSSQEEEKRLLSERQVMTELSNKATRQGNNLLLISRLPSEIEGSSSNITDLKREISKVDSEAGVTTDLSSLRTSIASLAFEIQQMGSWYEVQRNHLESSLDRASCPTCGVTMSEPCSTDKLEELSALIRSKTEERYGLENTLDQEETNENLLKSKKTSLASQLLVEESRLKELNSTYESLKNDLSGEYEEIDIDKVSLDLGVLKSSLEELSSVISKMDGDLIEATKAVALKSSEEDKVESSKNTLAIAESAEQSIKDNLSSALSELGLDLSNGLTSIKIDLRFLEEKIEQEKGRVMQTESALESISKRLSDIDAGVRKNKDKLLVIEELKQVKEIISKKGLPRKYIERKFHRLAKITAENLAILNSDFTVDVSDTDFISFMFERFDGTEQVRLPMSKMSGGQKVRLCIAFLLAVQQDLVTEVGFQTFDEPSTHLDEEGVDRLCSLFQKLQELLNTAEHQVWVCDHNPVLEGSFNKTLIL